MVALVGAGTAAALSRVDTGAVVSAPAVRTRNEVVLPIDRFVPPRRAYLISDSVLAGIELGGHADRLAGATWLTDLEVCRRLVATSCQVDGLPRPPTVLDELRSLTTRPDEFDLLVIGTGYNDHAGRLADDLATVVAAARVAGFDHVAWLDYRSDGVGALFSGYARMNAVLAEALSSGAYPDVTMWEFDAFTTGHRSWFGGDNLHLTGTGARAIADWLGARAAAYDVT